MTGESCGEPAGFITKHNRPYLEPHHTHAGSPDHPGHVIALCPTCHSWIHHSKDVEAYNAQLMTKLESDHPIEERFLALDRAPSHSS